MSNILIINLDENDVDNQFSSLSRTTGKFTYYLVSNGLPTKVNERVREFFDGLKLCGHEAMLFEYSQRQTTSKVFIDVFTWAMNTDCNTISYSDSVKDTGQQLSKALELLLEKSCLATGPNPVNQKYVVSIGDVAPAESLRPLFIMNMVLFRQAMRSMDIFQKFSKALEVSFVLDKEADFVMFFNLLRMAIAPSIIPKEPIYSFT